MSVEKRKFPYIIISNKGEPVQSINGLVWTFKMCRKERNDKLQLYLFWDSGNSLVFYTYQKESEKSQEFT